MLNYYFPLAVPCLMAFPGILQHPGFLSPTANRKLRSPIDWLIDKSTDCLTEELRFDCTESVGKYLQAETTDKIKILK